ncbi:Uncharacterised protein [Mycobacteroides abscessus subsp. abscessus]|nr:Uncharacterised protein [Mycobacteroides abscessus subsp. abscessus]
MITSVLSPICRNADRATGSMDQPTSWPCVLAAVTAAPAAFAAEDSSASGAAAPNHTTSACCARMRSTMR